MPDLEPSHMPSPPTADSHSLDRELLTFLREESEANRKSLREEADSTRKLFSDTLKIAAIPLSLVIAITGFLGWRSFSDLKESIQNEAKQETQAEISRMQQEIRDKLKVQFETPQLKQMVQEAATNQTGQVLRPLIEREVSSNVSRSVKEQQPTIHSTIVSEAHREVDALRPNIESIVNTRVNSTVDLSVDKQIGAKIQPVLTRLQQSQSIVDLETRAQGGDGHAFDQMVMIATNPGTSKELREVMTNVALNIIQKHSIHSPRHWTVKVTNEQILNSLKDENQFSRQTAIDSLPVAVLREHIDDLFTVMTTDPSLAVREAGFVRFNELMVEPEDKEHVDSLDNFRANLYFTAHREEMKSGKKSGNSTNTKPH
jgi:hypothetical protein